MENKIGECSEGCPEGYYQCRECADKYNKTVRFSGNDVTEIENAKTCMKSLLVPVTRETYMLYIEETEQVKKNWFKRFISWLK